MYVVIIIIIIISISNIIMKTLTLSLAWLF